MYVDCSSWEVTARAKVRKKLVMYKISVGLNVVSSVASSLKIISAADTVSLTFKCGFLVCPVLRKNNYMQ
jgi:hypothetical protein